MSLNDLNIARSIPLRPLSEVARIMGTDRVLFGSDWPHIEGMPDPLNYLPELKAFSDEDQRRILLDNVTELNTPQPL